MKSFALVASAAALAVSASAQITEIPAMTVDFTTVDMDSLPPGPTTLNAIRLAGNPADAPIAALTLTPNAAPIGYYNVNLPPAPSTQGRALGLNLQGNLAIIAPLGQFMAFDMQIDLEIPGTQFGIAIGDFLDEMVLEFYLLGQPIGSILTSQYTTAGPKFFEAANAFDRVTVRCSRIDGNWVVPAIAVQNTSPWEPLGMGCAGSNGTPTLMLSQPPSLGSNFVLDVVNLPTAPGALLMVTGLSDTFSAGFGPLPVDLTVLGMPGCNMYCDIGASSFLLHGGNTATFTMAIPNNPNLVTIPFFNQAYVVDPGINTIGATSSNAGRAIVTL